VKNVIGAKADDPAFALRKFTCASIQEALKRIEDLILIEDSIRSLNPENHKTEIFEFPAFSQSVAMKSAQVGKTQAVIDWIYDEISAGTGIPITHMHMKPGVSRKERKHLKKLKRHIEDLNTPFARSILKSLTKDHGPSK